MFGRGDHWKSLTFLSFYLPKFRVLEGGSLGVVLSQPAEHSARRPERLRDSGRFLSCVAENYLVQDENSVEGCFQRAFFSLLAFVL